MKKSEVMARAMELIADSEECISYACPAVSEVVKREGLDKSVDEEIREFIKNELDGYYTFDDWLSNMFPMHFDSWRRTSGKIKALRLDWMKGLFYKLENLEVEQCKL